MPDEIYLPMYPGEDGLTATIRVNGHDFTGLTLELEVRARGSKNPIVLSTETGELSLDLPDGIIVHYGAELIEALPDGRQTTIDLFSVSGTARKKIGAGYITIGHPGGMLTASLSIVEVPGTQGPRGWAPLFAAVPSGASVVLKVADWTGGGGDKPAVGQYVGPNGLVDDIEDATLFASVEGATAAIESAAQSASDAASDRALAQTAATTATTQAGNAQAAAAATAADVIAADAAVVLAETARDGAVAAGLAESLYTETTIAAAVAAGLADVADGDTFYATGADVAYIGVYRRDTGPVAVELSRFLRLGPPGDVNTTTYTLLHTDDGRTLRYTALSTGVVRLPASMTAGATVTIRRTLSDSTPIVIPDPGASLTVVGGSGTSIAHQWGEVRLTVDGNTDGSSAAWLMSGDVGPPPAFNEVLHVAGQSNAEAYGPTSLPTEFSQIDTARVKIWSGTAWVGYIAGTNSSPQAPSTRWGPEAQYALRWQEEHPVGTLYIVKRPLGATSLASWQSGGTQFVNMNAWVTAANATLSGVTIHARRMIWSQGEQEASTTSNQTLADAYVTNLPTALANFRSSWGVTDIAIGHIRRLSTSLPYANTVRQAQVNVCYADALSHLVYTDDFTVQSLGGAPDGLHYSTADAVTFGDRMYDAAVHGLGVEYDTSVTTPPNMTALNAPSGYVVAASSTYPSSGFEAWRAFDNDPSGTRWQPAAGSTPESLSLTLPAPIRVAAVLLRPTLLTSAYSSIGETTLAGSNDGTNWTEITVWNTAVLAWGNYMSLVVPLHGRATAYSRYRLTMERGAAGLLMFEARFYVA